MQRYDTSVYRYYSAIRTINVCDVRINVFSFQLILFSHKMDMLMSFLPTESSILCWIKVIIKCFLSFIGT